MYLWRGLLALWPCKSRQFKKATKKTFTPYQYATSCHMPAVLSVQNGWKPRYQPKYGSATNDDVFMARLLASWPCKNRQSKNQNKYIYTLPICNFLLYASCNCCPERLETNIPTQIWLCKDRRCIYGDAFLLFKLRKTVVCEMILYFIHCKFEQICVCIQYFHAISHRFYAIQQEFKHLVVLFALNKRGRTSQTGSQVRNEKATSEGSVILFLK